ncbi:MAG: ATP-binding protein [Bacteroidota bacterium]
MINWARIYLLLLSILFLCVYSSAQSEKYRVSQEEYPELRVKLDSLEQFVRNDLSLSLAIAKRTEELALEEQNPHGILELYLQLVHIYTHTRKKEKTRIYLAKCDSILNIVDNPWLEARIIHAIATNHLIEGKQNYAIEEFYKALKINQRYGFEEGEMQQLNNIGIILIEQDYFAQAIEYFTLLNEKSNRLEHNRYKYFSLGNIGYCHFNMNNLDEALTYTEEMIKFAEIDSENLGLCMGYNILAEVYLRKRIFDKAIYANSLAIRHSLELNFVIAIIDSYRVKAELHFEKNELDSSFFYSSLAHDLAEESESYRNFDKLLKIKYKAEKRLGNSLAADATLYKLYHFSDSINHLKVQNLVQQEKLYHEIEENERENELLKLQQSENELRLKNGRFYNGLLILSVFSIFLLCAILLLFYKRKQKYNQELEKNIAKRTEELEQSNKELERFSFIASHDLKEPIRTISSFSQLLEETIAKNSLEKSKEYLNFIQANSDRMQKLIDDILQFSQIRARQESNDELIDFNILLDEIVSLNAELIANSNAEIEIDKLTHVYANRSLMIILLKNLIENGIKYNDSLVPKISIKYAHGQKFGRLIIADNGIGIDSAYEEEIFEMFKRLHDLRKYQGTGIGLSMCKKIMEIHDGFISIESEVGKGTEFTLHFPVQILQSKSNQEVKHEMVH